MIDVFGSNNQTEGLYVDQAKSKRAKEVFLTQEEAKQKKLQKGYVLEPIVPKDSSGAQPVSAKRERKKSYHFGTTVNILSSSVSKIYYSFGRTQPRRR
jgi:hypothetical protein